MVRSGRVDILCVGRVGLGMESNVLIFLGG